MTVGERAVSGLRWPECPGVYFVECAGRVKIGRSDKSIRKRLSGLDTASPHPLTLLAYVEAACDWT